MGEDPENPRRRTRGRRGDPGSRCDGAGRVGEQLYTRGIECLNRRAKNISMIIFQDFIFGLRVYVEPYMHNTSTLTV